MAVDKGIKYATDNDVLNACEDGLLDWGYAETTELSRPESELSEVAKRHRGALYFALKGMDLDSAYQKYDELLPDNNRKIQYMSERVAELYEKGLLTKAEYDEYKETKKVTNYMVGLLRGLCPKDSERYMRLQSEMDKKIETHLQISQYNKKISFPKTPENLSELYGKMDGIGLPRKLAERYDELETRSSRNSRSRAISFKQAATMLHDHGEILTSDDDLTDAERLELKTYQNLKYILWDCHGIEMELAIKEFGVERILEYIRLNLVQPDPASPQGKRMSEIRSELENEPLLRHLNYYHNLIAAGCGSYFARRAKEFIINESQPE